MKTRWSKNVAVQFGFLEGGNVLVNLSTEDSWITIPLKQFNLLSDVEHGTLAVNITLRAAPLIDCYSYKWRRCVIHSCSGCPVSLRFNFPVELFSHGHAASLRIVHSKLLIPERPLGALPLSVWLMKYVTSCPKILGQLKNCIPLISSSSQEWMLYSQFQYCLVIKLLVWWYCNSNSNKLLQLAEFPNPPPPKKILMKFLMEQRKCL